MVRRDVMELIKILNYQGNKASLMPFISENIRIYFLLEKIYAIYLLVQGALAPTLKAATL